MMTVAAAGMLWRPREENTSTGVSLFKPDELFFIQPVACLLVPYAASLVLLLARPTAAYQQLTIRCEVSRTIFTPIKLRALSLRAQVALGPSPLNPAATAAS